VANTACKNLISLLDELHNLKNMYRLKGFLIGFLFSEGSDEK
jgi:hypothetical protein